MCRSEVIKVLKKKEGLTRNEIAKRIGKNPTTAGKNLQGLVREGDVRFEEKIIQNSMGGKWTRHYYLI